MDELTSQFGGGLSLNAAEWKPPGAAAATTQSTSAGGGASSSLAFANTAQQSDLNATAVKEFVPGQGWSASGTYECCCTNTVLVVLFTQKRILSFDVIPRPSAF